MYEMYLIIRLQLFLDKKKYRIYYTYIKLWNLWNSMGEGEGGGGQTSYGNRKLAIQLTWSISIFLARVQKS